MTPEQIKKTKAFQDWMDINHPNWVNGKNLNKGNGYGNFGASTRKAWNLYGDEFNSQYNPKSDVSTQTSTDKKVDPQIEQLGIYLNNIEFLSPNNEPIKITLDKNNKLSDYILNNHKSWKQVNPNLTLLQSLIYSLIKKYNISSFNAPESYKEELDKIISENIIEGVKGLKNILLEQFKKVSYVVKNGEIQKPTPKSADGPSTTGQPTGPLIEPKKPTPPVPTKPEPVKPDEGEKVTQQEVQQTLQNNANIKEIKKYSDRIKTTETPRYEACDNLFDNYESQLKLLKKQIEQGLIQPPKGDEPVLQDIKKKLKWCKTASEGKWRFALKFSQMSTLKDDKIKDSEGNKIPNPFKVNF